MSEEGLADPPEHRLSPQNGWRVVRPPAVYEECDHENRSSPQIDNPGRLHAQPPIVGTSPPCIKINNIGSFLSNPDSIERKGPIRNPYRPRLKAVAHSPHRLNVQPPASGYGVGSGISNSRH